MSRPPFSTNPPSHPSPYRYLGRGGGERPVRLQMIIALVGGLILVAVPLYLIRRPQPDPIALADAAVVDAGAGIEAGTPSPDAGKQSLALSPFTTIRCENPGPGKTPPERCDKLHFFEDGLSRAIRDNAACAPASKTPMQVSFVLEMDFRRKKLNLFSGKSTSVRKDKLKELMRCVRRALPTPDWATPHQYVKYKINVMATYPPNDGF